MDMTRHDLVGDMAVSEGTMHWSSPHKSWSYSQNQSPYGASSVYDARELNFQRTSR